MFTGKISKGFAVRMVPSCVEMQLCGAAPATTRYRAGQAVEFATFAEFAEFRSLAREFGSDVKCVGLPTR